MTEDNSRPAFIGVDWGSSNGRFLLTDDAGKLIAEKHAPGILRLAGAGNIERIFFETVAGWPDVPVVLTGLVGANIGWHPVPYMQTPCDFEALADAVTRHQINGMALYFVPGVKTRRPDGLTDVMRGEEMQIFGTTAPGEALLCLPGTHSKWAVLNKGRITQFHSAMTGELMELIGLNSILLMPKRPPAATDGATFRAGIDYSKNSQAGIETNLFTVRSRQIDGSLDMAGSENYLAGLMIGADIKSALALTPGFSSVTIVGAPGLTALYQAGLGEFGMAATCVHGRDAVLAGLYRAYLQLCR